jgi:uncharacterized membrane protein YhaH (DUF805 family)
MNFKNAIKSGFKNYTNFKGRAQRSEYWFWILFYLLVVIAGLVLESLVFVELHGSSVNTGGNFFPLGLIHLGLVIPTISVFVRRLHDTDRRGWWWLVTFIPFGGLVLFIWICSPGTSGANRFGEGVSRSE